MPSVKLQAIEGTFAICRLPPTVDIPMLSSRFLSVTRTPEETSIVCEQAVAPDGGEVDRNWRCFRCAGVLDFALTGVLESMAAPLAEAQISIFAISTYDTDYILVKADDWEAAVQTLTGVGFKWL